MAIDQVDRTVVTGGPTVAAGQETVQTESSRITRTGPGGSEMARRIVVFIFGLIQIVIGALFLTIRQVGILLNQVGPVGARGSTQGPRIGENITPHVSSLSSVAGAPFCSAADS